MQGENSHTTPVWFNIIPDHAEPRVSWDIK